MGQKRSIFLGVGVALTGLAVLVVVVAMLVVDQGEEMLHLYKDYRKLSGSGSSSSMELRGHWYGMSLASVGGATATRLGLGNREHGVVVADISQRYGQAARTAGIMPGDVITGVDQRPVKGLADLQQASQTLTVGAPVMVDVERQGRVVTLVLPPEQPQLAQPAALTGPQYYCPRDGIIVPGAPRAGGVGLGCPRCNGPLHLYHPGGPGSAAAGQGGWFR